MDEPWWGFEMKQEAGINATAGTPVRRFSRDENASAEGIGK